MKTIIAGSRSIKIIPKQLEPYIQKFCEAYGPITEIVCGMAKGIDMCGYYWAKYNGVSIKEEPAKWNDLSHVDGVWRTYSNGGMYDAKAGFRRNVKMAEYADALLLVWDGKSKGSKSMLELANSYNLKVVTVKR